MKQGRGDGISGMWWLIVVGSWGKHRECSGTIGYSVMLGYGEGEFGGGAMRFWQAYTVSRGMQNIGRGESLEGCVN